MYIRLTLYWGYMILLWLFLLVCILYCGCFNLFYNLWVCVCECVCGGVLKLCGCFGNTCKCIYCVLYCLFCVFCIVSFMYIYSYFFICTDVRTTATEWQLNWSNNNNNKTFINSFIPNSVLWEFLNLLKSQSSTKYKLVLPLSIHSNF